MCTLHSGVLALNGLSNKLQQGKEKWAILISLRAAFDASRVSWRVSGLQEVQQDLVEPGRILELWSMARLLYDLHSSFPVQRPGSKVQVDHRPIQMEVPGTTTS